MHPESDLSYTSWWIRFRWTDPQAIFSFSVLDRKKKQCPFPYCATFTEVEGKVKKINKWGQRTDCNGSTKSKWVKLEFNTITTLLLGLPTLCLL